MSKKIKNIERVLELKEVKDFATGVKTGKNTSSFRKFVDIEGDRELSYEFVLKGKPDRIQEIMNIFEIDNNSNGAGINDQIQMKISKQLRRQKTLAEKIDEAADSESESDPTDGL